MRVRRAPAGFGHLGRAVAPIAVGMLLVGCGGGHPVEVGSVSTTAAAVSTTSVHRPAATSGTTDRPDHLALAATATGEAIDVYPSVDATEPAQRITASAVTSADGIPITFLVADEGEDRIRVHLPVRPNGSTGWVERSDVDVSALRHRIEVSLGAHRIRVFEMDEVIVDEPVAVGRRDRPTPGGVYYLKELLEPPDPGGPYGPFAYGLSGFSNALESFNGGEAIIGIHGTNQPELLGQDVSSGCIRVHNEVITRLVAIGLPLGTPVAVLD